MGAVSEQAKARAREYNRQRMAALRATDPEAHRAKCRESYARDPEKYKAKVRAWRARQSPEQAKERARRIRLRQFYGMELEEFDALRAAQDYRCAICGRHEDDLPKVRPADNSSLFVDHSHETGCTRGLLCQSCNILVGHARESERILLAAIEYLAAHQTIAGRL